MLGRRGKWFAEFCLYADEQIRLAETQSATSVRVGDDAGFQLQMPEIVPMATVGAQIVLNSVNHESSLRFAERKAGHDDMFSLTSFKGEEALEEEEREEKIDEELAK